MFFFFDEEHENSTSEPEQATPQSRRVLHLDLDGTSDEEAPEMAIDAKHIQAFLTYSNEVTQIINNGIMPEIQISEAIKNIFNSYRLENLERIAEMGLKLVEDVKHYQQYLTELNPYLESALEKLHREHPETSDLTIEEFSKFARIVKEFDESEIEANDYETLILTAVKEAIKKHEAEKQPVSVSAVVPEVIPYPLDKVSQNLFKYLEAGTYTMNVEKSGSNDDIKTIITLDFDELEHNRALTFKKLTPFEKRVYVAAEALLEAGNEYVSATQIYRAMGGKGRPAPNQIERITESCECMAATRLRIDNQEETERYNYPEFQRGFFYLFPVERVENVTINGRITECCFHFLKSELPLFKFARQRKQITRYTPEQWALPFSMTDDNILLDEYFRSQIARMKRDKTKNKGSYNGKRLYSTIYENCEIDTKMKRSRAADKFRKLLNHYIKTGIITDYQEGKDGITITV